MSRCTETFANAGVLRNPRPTPTSPRQRTQARDWETTASVETRTARLGDPGAIPLKLTLCGSIVISPSVVSGVKLSLYFEATYCFSNFRNITRFPTFYLLSPSSGKFAFLPNVNRQPNEAAIIYLTMTNTSPRCTMTFWYSMYGSGIGTLSVIGDSATVWSKTGQFSGNIFDIAKQT